MIEGIACLLMGILLMFAAFAQEKPGGMVACLLMGVFLVTAGLLVICYRLKRSNKVGELNRDAIDKSCKEICPKCGKPVTWFNYKNVWVKGKIDHREHVTCPKEKSGQP